MTSLGIIDSERLAMLPPDYWPHMNFVFFYMIK